MAKECGLGGCMSDELKPCPFCGGTDVDAYEPGYQPNPDSWDVECFSCGVRGPGTDHATRQAAVDAWNARASFPDTIAEAAWRKANLLGVELAEARKEIERLKAAVDEAKMARATVAGVPVEFEPRGWGMW